MLLENGIPQQEPRIDVGIVLPQDRMQKVRISMPGEAGYALRIDNDQTLALQKNCVVLVRRSGKSLDAILPDSRKVTTRALAMVPITEVEPATGCGVVVRDVAAGRNFHWQKTIDVSLPGELHFRVHENSVVVANRLPFEHYVMCVATSEMSADCPTAFLEAQTITARSWMLANVEKKHRALDIDVCNDDCCQRYQGSTFLSPQAIAAASATAGEVVLYDDNICDARYSKSCGGVMEAFEAVWPGEPHPYLQVKQDAPDKQQRKNIDLTTESSMQQWLVDPPAAYCSPHFIPETELTKYLGNVDESSRYFRWQKTVSQEDLIENLNEKYDIQATHIDALHVLERGGSGRAIKLRVDYTDSTSQQRRLVLESEYAIRAALHPRFLYSSAIAIEAVPGKADAPKKFHIKGCGWGHGVGLCQIGGLGMALAGKSSEEILAHYYPGARVKRIY